MESSAFRIPAMALAFAVLAASPAASAQVPTPTREGNVWGWRDHQPTRAQTAENEKAAGIAPSLSQSDANAAAVDQLYRQLTHRSSGG
jgi:hypothetical protein